MRGPSSQDCEKSAIRTGVPSANMRNKIHMQSLPHLVQIAGVSNSSL